MPQIVYQANAATGDEKVAEQIKTAGSAVAGVKWVNANPDGRIVVTYGDGFDSDSFIAAIQSIDASVTPV